MSARFSRRTSGRIEIEKRIFAELRRAVLEAAGRIKRSVGGGGGGGSAG